jgi:ABC-type lipoprotein export system ATPase subunit
MSEYILEAKKVSKVYKDGAKKVAALEDVDLKVISGEYIAIVGPSGAGKSTLLHILGGLDSASSGQTLFEGKNINNLGLKGTFELRNKSVGFMFQFFHLLEELTVLENILLPCILARQATKKAKRQVKDIAQALGLEERLQFFPSQLSGGQQQKAAFARAIVNEPKVLFCDEPTGNLDHDSAQNLRDLIKDLNKKKAATVILVTHNLELAKDGQRVLNIKDGQLRT